MRTHLIFGLHILILVKVRILGPAFELMLNADLWSFFFVYFLRTTIQILCSHDYYAIHNSKVFVGGFINWQCLLSSKKLCLHSGFDKKKRCQYSVSWDVDDQMKGNLQRCSIKALGFTHTRTLERRKVFLDFRIKVRPKLFWSPLWFLAPPIWRNAFL